MFLLRKYQHEPTFNWSRVEGGSVSAWCVSEYDSVNEKNSAEIFNIADSGVLSNAFVLNSFPVILDCPYVEDSYINIGGKWILSGAAGLRLRNTFIWNSEMSDFQVGRRFSDFVESCVSSFDPSRIPEYNSKIPDVAVIGARNLTNYFHFLTETVPLLFCLVRAKLNLRKLIIHTTSTKVAGFFPAIIRDFFPGISSIIEVTSRPRKYGRVVSVFTPNFFRPEQCVLDPSGVFRSPESFFDKRMTESTDIEKLIEASTYDNQLFEFSKLAKSVSQDAQSLDETPKRLIIRRKPEDPRNREPLNMEILVAQLRERGFNSVHLEDYSPLQQVRLMSEASEVVGIHGAGFANMIFSKGRSTFHELGTTQTLSRWGDFIPLAHLSKSEYLNWIGDYDNDRPWDPPEIKNFGVIRPALSLRNVNAVCGVIDGERDSSGVLKNHDSVFMRAMLLFGQNRIQESFRTIQGHSLENFDDAGAALFSFKICDRLSNFDKAYEYLKVVAARTEPRASRFERLIWLSVRTENIQETLDHLSQYRSIFPGSYETFIKKFPRFMALLRESG